MPFVQFSELFACLWSTSGDSVGWRMAGLRTAAIDVVEAAYEFDVHPASWLPNLFEEGKALFDRGLGFGGAVLSGTSDGIPVITQFIQGAGPPDMLVKYAAAAIEVGPEITRQAHADTQGVVRALSEDSPKWPTWEITTRHLGCKDILELFAVDHDGHGISINIATDEIVELSPGDKALLEKVTVHIAAGHRLLRGLAPSVPVPGAKMTDLPLNAEALLDPKRFVVSEASGEAQGSNVSSAIRDAAVRIDRARGRLRKRDPDQALDIWQGLVRGRWSLVDWFDTDGRRFVLAKANAPHLRDPRGLTEREAQVATYASLGESGKIIGYRFGLSTARVSALLKAAMHKLGVKTQAQLVEHLRGLPRVHPDSAS